LRNRRLPVEEIVDEKFAGLHLPAEGAERTVLSKEQAAQSSMAKTCRACRRVSKETTSGVHRLKEMAAKLYPAITVSD
jgi:S-adenosylhomocysteine hydrolase